MEQIEIDNLRFTCEVLFMDWHDDKYVKVLNLRTQKDNYKKVFRIMVMIDF